MMYFMTHRRFSYESSIGSIKRSAMGHIDPLRPELISRGRPWCSNRELFEGILWGLRSGAGWPDLPSTDSSPSTCWPRLRRWKEDGTSLQVWRTLINWEEGNLYRR